MEEMTEEELDIEIEEKMRRLTPKQRELIEELTSWNLDLTEEEYLDRELKEAKHRLWTEVIENPEAFERLVKYIKDHAVCSLCGKKGCMLTKVIEGDRAFFCKECIIKNQTKDIVKVYKSDGSIRWEWRND